MGADELATTIEVDPGQVSDWLGERRPLQLIDVREPYEREAGHLDDTAHIQLVELAERARELQTEQPVVFYCRTGSRSLMAAQAFRAAGFEAYSMSGGLVRWVGEGRPIPGGGHVADH